jgi:hypothetical protein
LVPFVVLGCAGPDDDAADGPRGKAYELLPGDAISVALAPGESAVFDIDVPIVYSTLRLSGTGVEGARMHASLPDGTRYSSFPGTQVPRISLGLDVVELEGDVAPLTVEIVNPSDQPLAAALEMAEFDPGACGGERPKRGQFLLVCDGAARIGAQTTTEIEAVKRGCFINRGDALFMSMFATVVGRQNDGNPTFDFEIDAAFSHDDYQPAHRRSTFTYLDEAVYFQREFSDFRETVRYDRGDHTVNMFRTDIDRGFFGVDESTAYDVDLACKPAI